MKTAYKAILVLPALLLLSACASVPNGPSTMALPGTGKKFDQFRYDDSSCRQFAQQQIGGKTANQLANESFAGSAVVGTVIGAAIGAVAGGERGTGTGAATGLFVGSMIGINEANVSSYGAQHRYDNAYLQCMYAKGHRVPISGHIEQQPTYNSAPARPTRYPPPPPGYVPATPADAPK